VRSCFALPAADQSFPLHWRRQQAQERRIVGWSFFDRDRLIDACPDRKADINALYVNALHVARRWRQAIYPRFPIEREDPFAPKHTLDKYATLAGYQGAAAFQNATPAKWIRHTLDQLEATNGHYRQTTKQTKRDWHDLLEYNRHDCLRVVEHYKREAKREPDPNVEYDCALPDHMCEFELELHEWRALVLT
jgi:hypothetical protein